MAPLSRRGLRKIGDHLGCFDPNTGAIFINLKACYQFNYWSSLSLEENIENFIEQFAYTLVHEWHHAILFEIVGPEASSQLDVIQHITKLAI